MRRPRWHDVVLVVALVALFLVGVWALWWDDVRGPSAGDSPAPATLSAPAT